MESYVLVTAVKNEEQYLWATMASVAAQTRRPLRWIIVDDGSEDSTADMITEFSRRHSWIVASSRPPTRNRSFASQAYAQNHGLQCVRDLDYDYVGFLDGDITLPETYFEDLLERLRGKPSIGLAGGAILEPVNGRFEPRPLNRSHSVAGAVQLFRRVVFDQIGGLVAMPYGGLDTVAEVQTRMLGYETVTFHDLPAYHHRPVGTADGRPLRSAFRSGMMDWTLGYVPDYEALACLRRALVKPRVVVAFVKWCGYLWALFTYRESHLSSSVMQFVKAEQRGRITHAIRRLHDRTMRCK